MAASTLIVFTSTYLEITASEGSLATPVRSVSSSMTSASASCRHNTARSAQFHKTVDKKNRGRRTKSLKEGPQSTSVVFRVGYSPTSFAELCPFFLPFFSLVLRSLRDSLSAALSMLAYRLLSDSSTRNTPALLVYTVTCRVTTKVRSTASETLADRQLIKQHIGRSTFLADTCTIRSTVCVPRQSALWGPESPGHREWRTSRLSVQPRNKHSD
eukprot:125232-Pyramimonas_sp.AAC.2